MLCINKKSFSVETMTNMFPLLFLSRIFGIFPASNALKISKFLILYSIILNICSNLITIVYKSYYCFSSSSTWLKENWHYVMFHVRTLPDNLCILIHLYLCLNQDFKLLISIFKYKGYLIYPKYVTILGLGIIIGNFVVFSFFEFENSKIVYGNISIFLSEIPFFLVLMQFCTAFEVYKCQMGVLIKSLVPNKMKPELIENMAEIHNSIIVTSAKINEFFSSQLTIASCKLFVSVIYYAYFALTLFRMRLFKGIYLIKAIRLPVYCLFQLGLIYCIVDAAEKLSEKDLFAYYIVKRYTNKYFMYPPKIHKSKRYSYRVLPFGNMIFGRVKPLSVVTEKPLKKGFCETLLYTFSHSYGMFPTNSKLIMTKFTRFYSIFVVICVTLISLGIKIYYSYVAETPWLEKTWQKIIFVFRTVPDNLCLLFQMWKYTRNDFKHIIGCLRTENINIKFFYASKMTFLGIFGILLNGIIFSTIENDHLVIIIGNIGMMLSEIPSFCVSMLFCTFLEVYEQRMNDLISAIHPTKNRLEYLIERHQHLLELADKTNTIFSCQILVTCFKHFLNVIYYVYFTISFVKTKPPSYKLNVSITRMPLYAGWQLIIIYTIARSVENFTDKIEHFNYELFKIVRESKELCQNKKISLYLAMRQNVTFTACGFFTLGYPLLTSIIAAATTYLVILVQFSM